MNEPSESASPSPFLSPECAALIAAIEDGVCIQAPDSRIIHANQAFAEMIGKPLEQIIGKLCTEVFGCNNNGTAPNFCAHTASSLSGQPASEELSSTFQGRRLRARVSPLRNQQGEVTSFLMIVRDVTDVIAQERKLSRIEQLSRFGELAAGLAHEIKNPLAGIQGAVDIMLQRRGPHDPERMVLENVRREVQRIDGTVQMLLDRAKPRPFKLHQASLTEVVQRAVLLGQHQANNLYTTLGQNIKINFSPASQPILLTIDSAQIEDAVLNLILNSLEAIEGNGQIDVSLSLNSLNGNGRREAIITVKDNGRGIPDESLSTIFTPFFTTNPNGTGLGLPAVRRIMRAHGGKVEVNSTVGQGTVFTLHLPIPNK